VTIYEKLEILNGKITSDIINDLIMEWIPTHTTQKQMHDRYTTLVVPIQSRTMPNDDKINNKLNNDFFSEIIDTKVGYMYGSPIVYEYDGDDRHKDQLSDWVKRENAADIDATTGEKTTISGLCGRLLYNGEDGKAHVMIVPPTECIWEFDKSLDNVQYALRFYEIEFVDGSGVKKTQNRIEWYDDKTVTFFVGDSTAGYALEDTADEVPHMFSGVPLIPFRNNEENQSDCYKVLKLIDAYDRAISDENSEFEAFRLAYMKVIGGTLTATDRAEAVQTGIFNLSDEGMDIDFITKKLDALAVENHLDRLEKNIRVFAKSPNFNDENFGNESGEAKKYKLMALENKCIKSQRKFVRALNNQFQLIFDYWNTKGFNFRIEDLSYKFTRNLPLDLTYYATILRDLTGLLSKNTLLSLMPFIEDVDAEIEKMEAEEALYPDFEVPTDEG